MKVQEKGIIMCADSEKTFKETEINEVNLAGYHLEPTNKKFNGVIVCFGGSEGSCNYDLAERLCSTGFEVLALHFFGKKNLTEQLSKVPIEIYEHIIAYLDNKVKIREPITFISASKGAELCLNFTEHYNDRYNLVLYAPSAYRFQGLDFRTESSSWTRNNKELPFISFKKVSLKEKIKLYYSFFTKKPISFLHYYQSAIERTEKLESKRIIVDNFVGNILLFSGEEDKMWNSSYMSRIVKNANPDKVENHVYKEAGHCFGDFDDSGTYVLGGSKIGNIKAEKDSDKILMERLISWHV